MKRNDFFKKQNIILHMSSVPLILYVELLPFTEVLLGGIQKEPLLSRGGGGS